MTQITYKVNFENCCLTFLIFAPTINQVQVIVKKYPSNEAFGNDFKAQKGNGV